MKRILLLFLFLFPVASKAQNNESLHMVDSLKKVLPLQTSDTSRAETLISIGEYYYDLSKDSALAFWGRSETLCLQQLKKKQSKRETYVFKSSLARTYNNIAYVFQRNSLKTKNAFAYYTKALEIEQEIGNAKEEGKTLNNLATLYSNIGDQDNCIRYHHLALRAREKAGYTQGMIISLNNLTSIYKDQGEFAKALEYSQKAEEKALSAHQNEELPHIYRNRGEIFLTQGQPALAEPLFRKSLLLAKASGNDEFVCSSMISISNLFLNQGKTDSAIFFLREAMAIAEKQNTTYSIININNLMGNAFLKKNDPSAARIYIEKGLTLARTINRKNDISNGALLLSKIFEQEGNSLKALEMYKLHIAVRDSLFNETTRKNTIREQLKYDFDKKAAADSLQMDAEKKITNVQLRQEKTQRYALYGGLLLLVVFGGLMFNRFKVSQKQKSVIEEKNKETESQKKIIEEKQKAIVDSFNYAKRIQYSLLANETFLNEYFSDHFVMFRPKDIVSGDFYWAAHKNDCFYLAVCDSTGHGVPGAFMSLLSIGFLSEAINERNITEPHLVFNYVRDRLEKSISKDGNSDGFDGVLIAVNKKSRTITYAAANNNPVIIKNGEVLNLPCDKMPVGKGENYSTFSLFSIDYEDAGQVYLYTDGYADQFGGEKGKKLKYKNLEKLIAENASRPMKEQYELLDQEFEKWKKGYDQVDDVCVIGICIKD